MSNVSGARFGMRSLAVVNTVADAVANLAWTSNVVAGLPPEERAALGERLEMRFFERGDRLAVDGMEVDGLHFIVSGEVAILARASGASVGLATLRAGETVGHVELVLCRRNSIDAVATCPTVTLFLSRAEYEAAVWRYPNLLLGLYKVAIRQGAEARVTPPRTVRALPPPRVTEIDGLPESPTPELRPESLAPTHLPSGSAPLVPPEPGSAPGRWIFAGAAIGAATVGIVTIVALHTLPMPVAREAAAIAPAAALAPAVTTVPVPSVTALEPPPATAPIKTTLAGANKPRIKPRRSADNTRDASATASASSSAAPPAVTASSGVELGASPRPTSVRTVPTADDFGGRE